MASWRRSMVQRDADRERRLSTNRLAEMFNALHVPMSFKKIVTLAPALVYVIVRDLQVGQRIQKLVAEEAQRQTTEKKL